MTTRCWDHALTACPLEPLVKADLQKDSLSVSYIRHDVEITRAVFREWNRIESARIVTLQERAARAYERARSLPYQYTPQLHAAWLSRRARRLYLEIFG